MSRPRPINLAPSPKAQANRLAVRPLSTDTSWYRIENSASGAEVYLYDDIGWWGVPASDFVNAIKGVGALPISLHINSGGGDVWDGVAIYEAIRTHPSAVTVYIDGIAASAASLIAMAGDRVLIGKAATVMIHDALWEVRGNAADHADAALLLEKLSATISEVYADRAGGDPTDWRAAMRAGTDGTWYTATEALAAGLVDEIAVPAAKAIPTNRAPAPQTPPAVVPEAAPSAEAEPTWLALAAAYVSALKEAQ